MAELVELSSAKHKHLKVVPNSDITFASSLHALSIRVAEVGKAVSSFPIFLSRHQNTGTLMLTAVSSLEVGHNLFVAEGKWTANYQPTFLQTYPFYLMPASNEKGYVIGINEESDSFSTQEGEVLFNENDQASLYLSKVTALLNADIKNDAQTHQFTQCLEEMNLLKGIEVLVQYEDSVNTLKGLISIDEEVLQSLSGSQLETLNKKGYLAPIYAILTSIFQLNSLIQKHNALDQFKEVKQVKLKVAGKDS